MAKKRKPAPEEEHTSEDEEQLRDPETEEPSDDDNDDDDDDDDEEEEEEEEEEGSRRETVRKLLEPFGKDQLIEILKEAALKDRSIIDRISQGTESDPVHRKIFVHGLGWDSTTETLISVFKQYGQIEECNVVTDKLTGKSKGYGFVLFKTRDGTRKALKQPQKKIGNRMTSCQLAAFGPVPNHPVPDATPRKIYVTNVRAHVHPENLRAFLIFAKFGELEEGPLGYDRITGKLRGFAIFVYKTTEGCKKALEEPMKLFEGCKLQCQRAVEELRGYKNQMGQPVVGSAASSVLQPNDLALTYAVGLNPGMVSQNLNPAARAVLMGQSRGIGVLNPAALGSSLNHTGLSPSIASGLSPSMNRNVTAHQLGLNANFGGQPGINSISPSIIGSYGSQAAYGLSAYYSAQLGQSSVTAATRSQPGSGSIGTMPSYIGL